MSRLVPTVNDRTRPPLDVALADWFRVNSDADGRILPSLVEDDGEYRYATADEFAREFAAAYQSTGPDDLAGLLREAHLASHGPEAPAWDDDPNEWMARYLTARGVTLTGVRSSECRCADGHPDPAGLAAGTALHALGCPAGVRSSEVDGLREALDTIIALADGIEPDKPLLGHWRKEILAVARAALTGDTGPKVEPEPHQCEWAYLPDGTGECIDCGKPAPRRATPEPSNGD